jgi:hypothetical protein
MLVELLQPLGPDLVRRWVATLLMVPREEREGVVEAVERRVAGMYEQAWRAGEAATERASGPREVDVVHAPVQRDGYVEQVVTTYEDFEEPHVAEDERLKDAAAPSEKPKRASKRKKRA